MRIRSLFLAATLTLTAVSSVHATPVTYTLTGTFTGTLGTTSFTSTPGTITQMGDTSGVTSLGFGSYSNTTGVSSITLQGIGTASFLSPTFGAFSSTNSASFFDAMSGFGASLYDPMLGPYDLSAPFSDSSSTAILIISSNFLDPDPPTESTSLGVLSFTGDNGSAATFTATADTVTATPEPGSFALLGTGLLGAASLARKRMAKSFRSV